MSIVDVTDRLDEVQHRIVSWDLTGARDAVQELLGEPELADDDRLTARRLLAEVLRELGDLDAAYDLAEVVAAQAERRYGPGDPATVHAVAVLAAVRHDHDEWDEAERLYHRVLDSGIDEDGDDPVCRAVRLARVNLALLQRDRGDRALALVMLNAAYVVHRREYGAEDLDTIRIAAELAALHHADGNLAAARRLFTLAHAAARARLGTRHAFTRAVEWELAAVEAPMPSAPVSSPSVSDPDAVAPVADPAGNDPPAIDAGSVPASPLVEPDSDDPATVEVVDAPDGVEVVDAPVGVAAPEPEPPPPRPRSARPAWPVATFVVVVSIGLVLAGLALWRLPGPAPAGSSAALAPAPAVSVPAVSVPAVSAAASHVRSTAVPAVSGAGSSLAVRDLRLRDDRTELTVTWAPLAATVVVALSRAGAPATVVATLPPGTGEYVVRGVEPGVAYCVVLGTVDEHTAITPAVSVCTGTR